MSWRVDVFWIGASDERVYIACSGMNKVGVASPAK
jgi:hypothetical protein